LRTISQINIEMNDSPKKFSLSRIPKIGWVGIIALVWLVLMVFALRDTSSKEMGENHPAVGKTLDHLDLEPLTTRAETLTNADLLGRVALINFWGTWCPPCRHEMPHMADLADRLRKRKDFVLVSVSCGQGFDDADLNALRSKTTAYLSGAQLDLVVYADPRGKTRQAAKESEAFGDAYPTTLLLDRRGVIRGVWTEYRPGVELQVRRLVEKLLSEGAASEPGA
jgi:thiol-disulfide isomerase/thioredoxin